MIKYAQNESFKDFIHTNVLCPTPSRVIQGVPLFSHIDVRPKSSHEEERPVY